MYVQVGVQNATHTHTLSLIVTHIIVSYSLTETHTDTHTPTPPHPDILAIAVSNSRSTAHFVYMLPYCAQVSILHSPQQFVAHDGHSPNKSVRTTAPHHSSLQRRFTTSLVYGTSGPYTRRTRRWCAVPCACAATCGAGSAAANLKT